jgi:large subunit ribosomal protein L22
MEKQAISKFVRISAFKCREVTRLIQGKSVTEALALTALVPRKAARLVGETLASAVANAENDPAHQVSREDLVVKEATVGEAPTLKRIRTKARGMAGRVRKRSSHIRIVVSDQAGNRN